jgi:hypothetical protein
MGGEELKNEIAFKLIDALAGDDQAQRD